MCCPTNSSSSTSYPHDDLIVDWESNNARASRQLQPRNNIHRRQVVGFCETTQITEICGLWQMSDDEIASAYYSEEDRQRFKKDIRSNVKRMRKGCMHDADITNPEKYTERGLEHLASNDTFLQLQGERETLIDLVLEAQERGLSDDEIAAISARASRRTVKRAQRKALGDETEAKNNNNTSNATDTAKFLDESLRSGIDEILNTHPNNNHYDQDELQASKSVDTNQTSTAVGNGSLRSRQLSAQFAHMLLD